MNIPFLVPRLNYYFGFKDFLYSLFGIFKSNPDTRFLNTLFRTNHIYFTNHARTGLRLLLNSLGLKPNARIGVQAYNCHTVFNTVKLAGFQPVFIDINNDFRISIEDLNNKKNNIDALILTHTYGIPADFNAVKIAVPDIPIIEDCAHSFMSCYNDQITGKYGDAAIFSIGKGKFPSIGPGGYVIINNTSIIKPFTNQFEKLPKSGIIREISNIIKSLLLHFFHYPFVYAIFTDKFLRIIVEKKNLTDNFTHSERKILKCNLFLFSKKQKYLEKYHSQQKLNIKDLHKAFCKHEILTMNNLFNFSLNGFMFPVIVNNPSIILLEFKKNGIELGRHFSKSLEWAKEFGYKIGSCPIAENVADKVLVFPSHYNYKYVRNIVKLMINYEDIN